MLHYCGGKGRGVQGKYWQKYDFASTFPQKGIPLHKHSLHANIIIQIIQLNKICSFVTFRIFERTFLSIFPNSISSKIKLSFESSINFVYKKKKKKERKIITSRLCVVVSELAFGPKVGFQ